MAHSLHLLPQEGRMGKVQMKPRSVKGRVFYYPVGENAKHVLTLIRKKTLSELELDALKALGCEIERVPLDFPE